jgi:pimeloyl-ACP methyl ester carboxylesterase
MNEATTGTGNGAKPPIMLVHGFWVTPRSWEKWIERYEAKGHKVIAPGYPGFEIEVEALRENPQVIADQTINGIVDNFEAAIEELGEEPIIIGHSAGGTFTQVLLHRGHGLAAATICSAPTEGVHVTPLSQIKSTFEVLKNPANRHRAVGFSEEQWKYAFGNTLSEEESRALYERYHIPAPGRIVWQSVLANLEPGHQDSWVDYKNPDRAPLLFLSGGEDHIMPASVQASNAKHYKADGLVTEHEVYEGRDHAMVAATGWEEIADRALEWCLEHAE